MARRLLYTVVVVLAAALTLEGIGDAKPKPATVRCTTGRSREVWNGTLATNEGGPGVNGGTQGRFCLQVGKHGIVAGTGSSTSSYNGGYALTSTVTVTGQRTLHRFDLTITLAPGTSVAVVARIDGRRAEGTYVLQGSGGTYAAGLVKLRCPRC